MSDNVQRPHYKGKRINEVLQDMRLVLCNVYGLNAEYKVSRRGVPYVTVDGVPGLSSGHWVQICYFGNSNFFRVFDTARGSSKKITDIPTRNDVILWFRDRLCTCVRGGNFARMDNTVCPIHDQD